MRNFLGNGRSLRRSGSLRLVAILLALGAVPALGFAADAIRLAFLKAAPNVPPVTDTPRADSDDATREMHPARAALERNPIHDEANPDYSRLQRIDDATQHMKRDVVGFPDWMAAIRSGAINPRAGLAATDRMNVLDLDIVMRNTKEMPYVRFPHSSHTIWLDCSNCHPVPFLAKAGANPVSMSHIFRGQYCGMCHDRVAFITFFSCDRCHSVAQGASVQSR